MALLLLAGLVKRVRKKETNDLHAETTKVRNPSAKSQLPIMAGAKI